MYLTHLGFCAVSEISQKNSFHGPSEQQRILICADFHRLNSHHCLLSGYCFPSCVDGFFGVCVCMDFFVTVKQPHLFFYFTTPTFRFFFVIFLLLFIDLSI